MLQFIRTEIIAQIWDRRMREKAVAGYLALHIYLHISASSFGAALCYDDTLI